MTQWWDRPGRRDLPDVHLVTFNHGQWYLRLSRYQLAQHVIDGDLRLVGHRHDMFVPQQLRALRVRLDRETTGVVRRT